MLFSGSIPALITPFVHGAYHRATLKSLVQWHISEGSSALVICGTTGEGPTLGCQEFSKVLADAVRFSKGRLPIIAGTGSNSTNAALTLQRIAETTGAEATLHVTGYFNKPTQLQVIEHFRILDRSTRLPIIVYNVPGRTGQELSIETIAELANLENVIGIKDSTGNVARVSLERLMITRPFSFLSGDDATCLGYMAHGGNGCISVTANIAPALCSRMINAAEQGDFKEARSLQDLLMPLHSALFLEPNPAGIKYAMSKLGLCANELRTPLTCVTEKVRLRIDLAMKNAGLY
ncbi:MAG TPA: 4-hydroxy-tetrahydrodipicolinate synthase [Advenella kashmirensis]|uniref:4-hydroxy-tetrahydrodipicolinate synthase n=1 Tax=Advenella kashmirensis TaxID=310575 RepID=A0A356LFS6_9BURK|nr:4-hydroxy-tetrahydrodipicolinate synthase [Advenella kashmirensis]